MIYMRSEYDVYANEFYSYILSRACIRDMAITLSARYIDTLMTRAIKNSETRIMRNRALCNENTSRSTRYAAWIPMQMHRRLRARKITRLRRDRDRIENIHAFAIYIHMYSKNSVYRVRATIVDIIFLRGGGADITVKLRYLSSGVCI